MTVSMIFSWRYFERVGLSWLTPLGLAGTAVYVIGHGLVKAALFLCAGIVLHRLGSVNETWLHGRGRKLPVTGAVFTLAALGLADLPPFATYLGKGWIEDTGAAHGMAWVAVVLVAASVLSAGRCCGSRAAFSTAWATPRPGTPRRPGRPRRRRARPARASSTPRSP